MRHEEAYQYLRLIWEPLPGQRVEWQGKRYHVLFARKGEGLTLNGIDACLYPGQVKWRPTPKDFNAVLDGLAAIFEYRQVIEGDRQVVGIKCNGRIIPIRGRSVQILSTILALRTVDSSISIHINNLFESAQGLLRQQSKVPTNVLHFTTEKNRHLT